jgi:hypothetical protein
MSHPALRRPGYKSMIGKISYSIKTICGNCGRFDVREVPKGTTIENFLKVAICTRCQCEGTLSLYKE